MEIAMYGRSYISICFTLVFLMYNQSRICNADNDGVCLHDDGSSHLVPKCCSNYVLVNKKCEVCPPGFIGVNCSHICPKGKYGTLCKNDCECSNVDCDHAKGCATSEEDVMLKRCSDTLGESQHQNQDGVLLIFSKYHVWILIAAAGVFIIVCVTVAICLHLRKRRGKLKVTRNGNPGSGGHDAQQRRLRHESLSTEATYRAANNVYIENQSVTSAAPNTDYIEIIDVQPSSSRSNGMAKTATAGPGRSGLPKLPDRKETDMYAAAVENNGGYNVLTLKRNFTEEANEQYFPARQPVNVRSNSFKQFRIPNFPFTKDIHDNSKSKTLPLNQITSTKPRIPTHRADVDIEDGNSGYHFCDPVGDDSVTSQGQIDDSKGNLNTALNGSVTTLPYECVQQTEDCFLNMNTKQFQEENNTETTRRRLSRPIFNRLSKLMGELSSFRGLRTAEKKEPKSQGSNLNVLVRNNGYDLCQHDPSDQSSR